MTPIEAEKLLGGYATGTLTEGEKQSLFAAALERQELFDALADEEALRELLADPDARAQLLAALAPAPGIVPFWRRTGVLGAAASLLVAATAGLVYLRSPEKAPPPLQGEAPKPQAPLAPVAPAAAGTAAAPARKALPPPPAKEAGHRARAFELAPAVQEASQARAQPVAPRAEDRTAQKAEAPRPVAAEEGTAMSLASPPAAAPTAKAMARADGAARPAGGAVPALPAWTLATGPDGLATVTIRGPLGARCTLLKRSAAGVEALRLVEEAGQWRVEVRLAPGDALDLYLLNRPVADPTRLPETGPVDGFRARIHPAAKKDPGR